ncbi:TMEM45B [Scenedesmus sp. PABB004]|nr:TMEM45B [Scenedesmus sp. PABB004]
MRVVVNCAGGGSHSMVVIYMQRTLAAPVRVFLAAPPGAGAGGAAARPAAELVEAGSSLANVAALLSARGLAPAPWLAADAALATVAAGLPGPRPGQPPAAAPAAAAPPPPGAILPGGVVVCRGDGSCVDRVRVGAACTVGELLAAVEAAEGTPPRHLLFHQGVGGVLRAVVGAASDGAHAGHSNAGSPATSLSELTHPPHGSFEGHLVPGVMFIALAAWWTWSVLDSHLRAAAPPRHAEYAALPPAPGAGGGKRGGAAAPPPPRGRRRGRHDVRGQPFVSRTWWPWPAGWFPGPAVEPAALVVGTLLGIAIELYIGWGGPRPLYSTDGHFAAFHANNYQHALMYAAFLASGLVDLLGAATPLPRGVEQCFLALAFFVEALLMGLHTKPNPLDELVHWLLTHVMLACCVAAAAEVAAPRSLLLAVARCMLVMLQDAGGLMFVPVVFGLHVLLIALGTLAAYVVMAWLYARLGITAAAPTLDAAAPGSPCASDGGDGGGGARDWQDLLEAQQLELGDLSGGARDAAPRGKPRR